MITIAVANNKGGTGKTTTTIHLGQLLAAAGWITALIDFDGQANLTNSYAVETDEAFGTPGIVDLIRNTRPLADVLIPVAENLFLCPSSPRLDDVADEMTTRPLQIFRLKTALDSAKGLDVVIIDCPPNLGSLTYSALIASTHLIVPVEPDGWSIDGLQRTVSKLPELQKEIGHAPQLLGTVATKVREDLLAHRTSLTVLHGLGVPVLAEIPRREGVSAEGQLSAAYQPVAAAVAALIDRQEK